MPISLEDLEKEEDLDIFAKIMTVFDDHPGEALGFGEISNAIFEGTYEFHIEDVRTWMPFNQFLIYGDLRQVYYRITVIGTALTLLAASGKIKTKTIRNPNHHTAEFSPDYLLVYYVPQKM